MPCQPRFIGHNHTHGRGSDLVLETFKGLVKEVQSEVLLREYVDSIDHGEIAKATSEGVCPHVELLAKNLNN